MLKQLQMATYTRLDFFPKWNLESGQFFKTIYGTN